MSRDDVPEQDVLFDPELVEDAVDDRRGRLGRPGAGELALGGEGDAADPGTAISRGLADEDDRGVPFPIEVLLEAFPPQARTAVLIERVADPRARERGYQRSQRTTSSSGFQGNLRREPPSLVSGAA
jgi:hypothetical protein